MDKDSITLHPEKGVNPHLTRCSGCGADTDEIVLLGTSDYVLKCLACEREQLGKKRARKCVVCGARELRLVRQLEERERVTVSLCAACQASQDAIRKAVAEGGVYWKCADCNASGAIKAESPLAQEVRKTANIQPPNPCGVEFTKADCPACGVEN